LVVEVRFAMTNVAGLDGTPGGWAAVLMNDGQTSIRKMTALTDILDPGNFDLIAIDIPIGLLDGYEIGGRTCDRAARRMLGRLRASSVFPAPVRPVLTSTSWPDACSRSRASATDGKAVTKQTFAILDKIKEVDDLLQQRHQLRGLVREVHPEVCFSELTGAPMAHRKGSRLGREERRDALTGVFPDLHAIEATGRAQGIPVEDILDAAIACWSASRLAGGKGRSLLDPVPADSTGLPMTIWV
jgi:predicted RNase H-like nuclease